MATFSRGRKPKGKPISIPKPKTIPEKREGFVLRTLKFVSSHWVASLLSLVAALIAVGTLVWQVLVGPSVDISEAGAFSPLDAPIQVVNRSVLFSMYDASITCRLKAATWSVNFTMKDFILAMPTINSTIAPGEVANFQCRIGDVGRTLEAADIFITIRYYTLWWWSRGSDAAEFTWFTGAIPPRWIKGAFVAPVMK